MVPTLLGKKIGMTQVYLADGQAVPVTVVQAGPCTVVQVKREATDGYNALQIGIGSRRPHGSPKRHSATKPATGHAKKSGVDPACRLREVPWDGQGEVKPGQPVTCQVFEGVRYVDVVGTSKGRGFAGVMKRHGFHGGPATHGQSDRARAPGAIGGGNSDPSRVWKGKKMPGQMGNVRRTARNLEVVRVDAERSVLLIKGAVPGPNGGWLLVRKAKTKSAAPVASA